jgi:hypothetical protein
MQMRYVAPIAAVLLTGCVSAQATMLGSHRYAPVPSSEVHVYLSAAEVPEACERIALIHTQGDAETTNERQMIAAARRRAGKVGANAVQLENVRDPSTGTRIAAAVIGISAERKGEMLALRCDTEAAGPVAKAAAN